MTTRFLPSRVYAVLRLGLVVSLLLTFGACAPRTLSSTIPASPPAGRSTEQTWIIAAVARDLVNLATFAAAPEHWHDLPAGAVDVRETAGNEPGLGYTLAIRLPDGAGGLNRDKRPGKEGKQ